VVGGGRAYRLEKFPALFQGADEGLVIGDWLIGDLFQLLDILPPIGRIQVDDPIGAKTGDDPAIPAFADGLVQFEGIGRGIGGGKDFKVEAFEQGARRKFGLGQLFGNQVIKPVGIGGAGFFINPKDFTQFVRQPDAGGCAAKKVKILAKGAPDLTVIALNGAAIPARNAQAFERNALRVKHPRHIVVGNDEQVSRGAESGVGVAEQARVNVSVRGDNRQVGNRPIEFQGQAAGGWVRGKEAVRGQISHHFSKVSAKVSANLYYNQIQEFDKMKKRRVTVEDVARAAGVSLMTVSRAINGREGLGEETRARILALAQEMGYHPSQIARSLATRQTATIGLVVPDVSNPFFAQIARGAEDAAYESGYNVYLLNGAEDLARERAALDSLWQNEVDGVILCSSRLPQAELQVYFERFPQTILVNRELETPQANVASINVDDRAGAELAMRHLLESGRRRVAFLAGPETSISGQRRLAGYRAGLGDLFEASWIEYCPPTTQGGMEAALRLLERHPELEAFLAYNDLVAVGALQACKAGWKIVPTETAVIGADDIPLASLVQPQLSTLRVNQTEIGRMAIALLLEMLAGGPARALTISPELVVRGSG